MPKKLQFLFLFLISFMWFACTKVDIEFGDQLLDNTHTQLIEVDTFTASLSTVYVDSFLANGKGVSLIGGYTDPVFGKIQTNHYFEVIPPNFVDSFQTCTYDSLELILQTTKSYYGDTTKPVHIIVNRVAEPIQGYNDNLTNIFNIRSFAVYNNPLGTKDFMYYPSRGDSIAIRLDDNLGREILSKLQDPNDVDTKTSSAFLQYIYGLQLSSSPNSPIVFSCKDSVIMRLHFKRPALYLLSDKLDFTLANANHSFNHTSADRTGTILQNLSTDTVMSSSLLNNAAYTQYASGAMIKIRFPSIRDAYKLPNFVKIVKATLTVRPVAGSYGTYYFLPPALRLSTTTSSNLLGSDLAAIGSSSTVQTGNLVVDYLHGQNTAYTYDLTSYLNLIIQDASTNQQNGLLLTPPSPALETQFSRVIVGDKNNTNGTISQIQLSIIYAAVQ